MHHLLMFVKNTVLKIFKTILGQHSPQGTVFLKVLKFPEELFLVALFHNVYPSKCEQV